MRLELISVTPLMKSWRGEGDQALSFVQHKVKGATSKRGVVTLCYFRAVETLPAAGRGGDWHQGEQEALTHVHCLDLSPLQQWQMNIGVSEDNLLFSCSVWRCVL